MTFRDLICLFILIEFTGTGMAVATNHWPQDVVYCIYQDHKGVLWLGTDTGLHRRQEGQGAVLTTSNGLSGNSVTAIFEDRDHQLWVGTMGSGLNRYDRDKKKFTIFTSKKNGLSGDMIYSIDQDNSGTLWIGTSTGLNRFKDGRFTSYTVEE